jgi:hypothetical protein
VAQLCAVVELAELCATPGMAVPHYQPLVRAADQGLLFPNGWMVLLPRVLGVAATLNRRLDKAAVHFQAAMEIAQRLGAQPELGRTCLDYAQMLAVWSTTNDRPYALELLHQAAEIFHALGMPPFIRRVQQLTEALQTHSSGPTVASFLSPAGTHEHEINVLLRFTRGRTNFLG